MEKRPGLIDMNEALGRLDNDMSLYLILVDAFLEDKAFQPERLRELEAQFRAGGAAQSLEAAQYIHRLKGAARQLSANALADEAQKLEDIFRGKAPSGHGSTDGGPPSTADDSAALVERILDLHQQTAEELGSISG